MLTGQILTELHPYLVGTLNSMNSPALQVGGTADHVHLLFGLSRTLSVAETVETLKTSSSKWLKTKSRDLDSFHWQAGYGVFSVSQSQANPIIVYIQNQPHHHKKTTFQDEFRLLLRRHQIPFDERHVWD
jgi:putative transposase